MNDKFCMNVCHTVDPQGVRPGLALKRDRLPL